MAFFSAVFQAMEYMATSRANKLSESQFPPLENGGTNTHLRAALKIERKYRSTYFHTWHCLMAVIFS